MIFIRASVGFFVTLLINLSLTMIPFALLVVIFQTSPFWTSILSYYINKEPIYPIELAGMLVCFLAVLTITFNEDD